MKKSSLKYQKKETNFVPSYVTSPLLFILSKKDDLLFGEKKMMKSLLTIWGSILF